MKKHCFSKPLLILVSGPPGVGKSTLAREIVKRAHIVYLEKDCIDEPFSPDDRGKFYEINIEPRSIKALLNLARINLKAGQPVLIDLPWSHILLKNPFWIDEIKEICTTFNVHLKVIECGLEPLALKKRLMKRGFKRDAKKLTEKGWKEFLIYEKVGEKIPLGHKYFDLAKEIDWKVLWSYLKKQIDV